MELAVVPGRVNVVLGVVQDALGLVGRSGGVRRDSAGGPVRPALASGLVGLVSLFGEENKFLLLVLGSDDALFKQPASQRGLVPLVEGVFANCSKGLLGIVVLALRPCRSRVPVLLDGSNECVTIFGGDGRQIVITKPFGEFRVGPGIVDWRWL